MRPKKYEFYKKSIKYLGLIIRRNGVLIDLKKVEAI